MIIIANTTLTPQIVEFCGKYLTKDNDAIFNQEFLCEFGLRAAIKKNNVIVAIIDNKTIVGVIRFYPNIRKKQISIYQFAVSPDFRGKNIVINMLNFLHETHKGIIISKSINNSSINEYYKKTGWKLHEKDNEFSHWKWEKIL